MLEATYEIIIFLYGLVGGLVFMYIHMADKQMERETENQMQKLELIFKIWELEHDKENDEQM